MFITTPDAELVMYTALFLKDGAKQWSYLELATALPWYCIGVRVESEGFAMRRTLHLSDHRQLIGVSEAVGDALELVEVALPSHYTGKEGWTMVPLRAIWRGADQDGITQWIYVSRTGRRYSSSEGRLHERDLEERELMFKLRPRHAR